MEQLVLKSEVEVALINNFSHSPRITVEPYSRERIVLFATAKNPLAKKRHLTVHDLLGVSLVIRKAKGDAGSIEQLLTQYEPKLKARIIMRCESPEAVKTAVRENMGIGALYHSSVKLELQSGDFKILKLSGVKLEGQSYIIYRRDRRLSVSAQAFLALLRQSRDKTPNANKRFVQPVSAIKI